MLLWQSDREIQKETQKERENNIMRKKPGTHRKELTNEL